ncbi:MAG: hypothetical protein ACYSVY_28520, partial [Planctomycetota bacterium]
ICYTELGDVSADQEDWAGALEAYEAASSELEKEPVRFPRTHPLGRIESILRDLRKKLNTSEHAPAEP